MGHQYPFWLKNRADAAESSAMSSSQQLEQCREKLRHVTCPKCGHTFNVGEVGQSQPSKAQPSTACGLPGTDL